MTYGLWLSAGGLQVNEYRQALAANNMANVDTVGFKRDLAVIHERLTASAEDVSQTPYADRLYDALSGGVWTRPTYTSFEQGAFDETGGALDAAINGDGFFTVSAGGDAKYTRDGRFVANATGELVMSAGDGKYHVLDAAGAPIVLDPAAGEPTIATDGTVYQDGNAIAKLGVVSFDDTTTLRKAGEGVFENVGDASPTESKALVLGGYVERSTVDPVGALAGMIEVSRAYELNARMISLQDETLGQAVSRVGRIG